MKRKLKSVVEDFSKKTKIKVIGFYSREEIKNIEKYMNRYVLSADVVMDNYDAVLLLEVEDEIH
jgi:hypothetical protein